jgi:tetratricopeptide (TPR) repeat protein
MGNTDNAIKDFSTVIRLDRKNAGAWNNRAIIKGQQGNFCGAIIDLDTAIQLQNDLAPAYYLRGVAKFKIGLNGCDDLHKAVSLNYTNAEKALQFYCGE